MVRLIRQSTHHPAAAVGRLLIQLELPVKRAII